MDVEFRKITEFPRGTLAALLKDSYSFEPKFERDWHKQWQEFDDFFYDNPHIAEFSGFMTVLGGKPIGFVSWNPTNLPQSTEVGHNCILTKYKGNGYGKRQMQQAVARIIAQGAKKIVVWTNEICVPAQHNYESVGFQFVKKSEETFCPEYAGQRIHYEIVAKEYKENNMITVQKWEVFELLLHGTKEGNPFVSVELTAQFIYKGDEDNRPLCVDGFYDGDGIYKVRFMPDKIGVWTYCTHANQKELDNITGQIECIDNDLNNHGVVRIKNTYHFSYEDGTVYYPFGTTCYAWIHQPMTIQQQTIETLKNTGFNKIRMCVFPKFYANNSEEPFIYPYQGQAPNQWDFEQFNPPFFQALEERIIQLGKIGIEVDLILFHPYDKGHWGFDSMGKEADLRYLSYIVARLSAFHNVWWSMANEYDYIKSKTIEDWNTYIEYVSKKDIYKHLLSIHNAEHIFDNWNPNITHASIQIGTNSSMGEVSTGFGMYRIPRDIYHKAVIFDEVGYEGDLMQRWGCMSAKEIVDKYWKAICSGTYMSHGETYSSDDDVIWWAKGGQLKGEAWKRILFLKKIVEESGTDGLEPLDLWWILNGVGVHGQYYLFYFSDMPMNQWTFKLPAFKKPIIDMGTKFTVDIIDTWNMTIERLPVEYVVDTSNRYYYQSKTTPFIALKGQQNIALRIVKKELL